MAFLSKAELDTYEYINGLRKILDTRTDELVKARNDYNNLKAWFEKVMEDPYSGPLMKQAISRYKLANLGYEEHTGFFNGK
jgi:hypothetical protein